jgi:hypothetical protein
MNTTTTPNINKVLTTVGGMFLAACLVGGIAGSGHKTETVKYEQATTTRPNPVTAGPFTSENVVNLLAAMGWFASTCPMQPSDKEALINAAADLMTLVDLKTVKLAALNLNVKAIEIGIERSCNFWRPLVELTVKAGRGN